MSTEARERAESNSSASSNGGSIGSGSITKTKRQKHANHLQTGKPKMRPVTVETVRRIVAQEGRSARNLISWNAPLDMENKPKTANGSANKTSGQGLKRRSKSADTADKKVLSKSASSETKYSAERKPSAGKRQVSIRARYWAYLFENLRRAVDEIYATCETDQSVVECKEVLLVLDNYRHDFQALIDWINLQEKLNSTDVANRPTSLAWEVRKSSPGRPRQRLTPRGGQLSGIGVAVQSQTSNTFSRSAGNQPSSHIKRSNSDKKITSSSAVTWADRVKGVQNNNGSHHHQQQRSPRSQNRKAILVAKAKKAEKEDTGETVSNSSDTKDDEDGWEKVSVRNKTKSNRVQFTKVPATREEDESKSSDASKNKNSSLALNDNQNAKVMNGGNSQDMKSLSNTGAPDFSGIVVERSMGTANAFSYGGKSGHDSSSKVAFVKDGANKENDISLQMLDDVEAEFFKSEATLASDDEDSSVLTSLDATDSKANMALLQHEASIAAAEKEEEYLMKEIEAEENKPIDTESTAEIETPSGNSSDAVTPRENSDWNSVMARFEADQEMNQGMTWGDMIDDEELREPGRAVQMHEKLSSPSRKRTPAESRRKMEEKQRSATLRRQKMVQDKTERIHILTERVDDVRRLKADLIMGKTELLKEFHAEKLQRAEQQRALKLMKIVQKAQAEETKVNEILFINELQEQNKRHDVFNRIQEHDARLQEIQQERSKMFEVKAAKEENVKERRRLLEKERQERLGDLINKRKEHDSRIEQLKQEREKEREKLAREKERDRRTRISALNAAQQEAVTELQKKIQIKHDESVRRHQEQLEQRKEKALELSLGRFSLSSSGNTGDLQNSMFEGEKALQKNAGATTSLELASDGRDTGKGDASFTSKNNTQESSTLISPRTNSSDEEKKLAKVKEARQIERRKAMKKRAKKLKTRMATRGKEFLKTLDQKQTAAPNTKNKVYRLVKDINRQLIIQKETSGPWPANRVAALDRALGEIHRLLGKQQDENSKTLFRSGGGFEMLERVFEVPLNTAFQNQRSEAVSIFPDKTVANAASVFEAACEDSYESIVYVLYSGRLAILVDALTHQLTKHLPEDGAGVKSPNTGRKSVSGKSANGDASFDQSASALLRALAYCLGALASCPPIKEDGKFRLSDDKQLLKAMKLTVTSSKANSPTLTVAESKKVSESFLNRGLDIVSYIVSCGVLDKLSIYLGSVRCEIDANSKATGFIVNGLAFLHSVTEFVALRNRTGAESSDSRTRSASTGSNVSNASGKKESQSGPNDTVFVDPQTWDTDSTQLLPTLYHTEVMGVVSVLYGILLHGAPERPILLRTNSLAPQEDAAMSSSPMKTIPAHVLRIAKSVMIALNAVADLDIQLLQESLGAEGVSLEFRHICAYLLWYCQESEHEDLLHEVIVCVGHFALGNKKNQETVHSGAMPTVLQQLCVLPFSYFSNPHLSNILFPTLIACCHGNHTNLAMLEQEASSSLLSGYLKEVLVDLESNDASCKSPSGTSKRSKHGSLSCSRFYTVTFLRNALRFFETKKSDECVNLSNDQVSTAVSS